MLSKRFQTLFLLVLIARGLESWAAVDAWELVSPTTFDWREAGQRGAIAEDLLERLELLASVIPPQSSDQQTRIEHELDELKNLDPGVDPRRRSRLYLSRRYQHFRLLKLLNETRMNLRCVIAAREIDDEMRCWGLASVSFGEESKLDLALSMLRGARLIPKDGAMPIKAQDPALWYGDYGRGILKYILVPHLATQSSQGSQRALEDKPRNSIESIKSDDF